MAGKMPNTTPITSEVSVATAIARQEIIGCRAVYVLSKKLVSNANMIPTIPPSTLNTIASSKN